METIYNSITLDDAIPEFTTVNVKGRVLLAPKLQTQNVPARDGDIVLYEQFPPRDIEVTFLIEADNSKQFNDALRKLNSILYVEESGKDIEFGFTDEEGTRYGRLSSFSPPPENYFNGTGTFTIHAQDPFLHVGSSVDMNYGSDVVIDASEYDSYLKLRMFFMAGEVTDPRSVTFNNVTAGKQIRLINLPETGELIIKRDHITLNGAVVDEHLDVMESTWKEFPIRDRDYIMLSGLGNAEIAWEVLA